MKQMKSTNNEEFTLLDKFNEILEKRNKAENLEKFNNNLNSTRKKNSMFKEESNYYNFNNVKDQNYKVPKFGINEEELNNNYQEENINLKDSKIHSFKKSNTEIVQNDIDSIKRSNSKEEYRAKTSNNYLNIEMTKFHLPDSMNNNLDMSKSNKLDE